MPEPEPRFHYRGDVLMALAEHGIRPRTTSDPRRVYELLKSLYSWELRRLKADFRALERRLGKQPLASYRDAAARLLDLYAVLRLPPHEWVEEAPGPELPPRGITDTPRTGG